MKIELTIPENWNDITIGLYQKYIKLQESDISEKKKTINSLALLCNTTKDIIKKISYKDLRDIMNIVKKLVDSEPNKKDFIKTFMFKEQEYGFVPNLSKLTTGEYIDLESYTKDPIENLHIIMSILYRPITFKRGIRYTTEPYDPEQFKEELFKDCPMNIALTSLGFFLTLGEVLQTTSLNYLKKAQAKMTTN